MAGEDAGNGPDQGQPGDKGGEGTEENKFTPVTYKTQEEMDAAFAERATRAANSAKAEALKGFTELGIDPSEALRIAAEAKQAEEAKKSSAVKAQERAEAAERELATLRAREARGKLAKEIAGTVKFGETPLPAELLAGDTKEEMEAFAKGLVDFFNSVSGPRPPAHNPAQGHSSEDKVTAGDPIRNWMASGAFA